MVLTCFIQRRKVHKEEVVVAGRVHGLEGGKLRPDHGRVQLLEVGRVVDRKSISRRVADIVNADPRSDKGPPGIDRKNALGRVLPL